MSPGLSWSGSESLPVGAALEAAREALDIAGCSSPQADAELLLAAAMKVEAASLRARPDRPLAGREAEIAADYVQRRVAREPIEYILGACRYRGLELVVERDVIVPSEERTSLLVELALGLPAGASLHDVGTGCGAIPLALKHERPDLAISGSDVSAAAVRGARANASRLALDVKFTRAANLPPGAYDLVLANPPYGREEELTTSAPPEEALYQPHVGLVAGEDGLDMIRGLIASAPTGTRLAVEHGHAQGEAVRALLSDARTTARTHPTGLPEQITVGRA